MLNCKPVVGYGVGELTIDQSNYSREALASRSYSVAIAGNKELYSSDTILNGITNLSVIGDSWFARQYVNGQDDLIKNLQTDAQYYNVRPKERINMNLKVVFTYTTDFRRSSRRFQKSAFNPCNRVYWWIRL